MGAFGGNGSRITAAASAGRTCATAASFRLFADQDGLESDGLKGQLFTGTTKETHRALGGFVNSSKLDADRFSPQMGEVVRQFAVKDEGDVGVELLLKLPELTIAKLPRTLLEHGQHEDILAGIMGEGIEHSCPLDARAGRRGIMPAQIFAEGNHT